MQVAEENADAYDKTEVQRIVSLCKDHEEEDNVKRQTSRFTNNVQSPNPVEEAKKHKAVLRQVSFSLNLLKNKKK